MKLKKEIIKKIKERARAKTLIKENCLLSYATINDIVEMNTSPYENTMQGFVNWYNKVFDEKNLICDLFE